MPEIQALLITPEANVVPVDLPSTSRERLTAMYSVLRCSYVDVVRLTTQLDMWLDDEGLYNHPVNEAATMLAARFGWTHQAYHGPVLLTGGADEEGNTLPLDTDKARALLTALADL
ncbi:DUF3846 domain-containing protein [Streptomyces sp. NPDC058745]|uniref:DUF3846 domain-containing protein n=1 Tax=Streptomyces sp. NPDC058745 TaxID=3346621 RepID=UPI0036AF5700